MLSLAICVQCNAQDTAGKKNSDSNTTCAECKVTSYKRYKNVYYINFTYAGENNRVLSPKAKEKKGIKINKVETYNLILNPYFQENDSIISLIIPDFIVVNNAVIPYYTGFSTYLFQSPILIRLYYFSSIANSAGDVILQH